MPETVELSSIFQQVKDVEREFQVVSLAMGRLMEETHEDPIVIGRQLKGRDIERAFRNLEGTYFIRMFAEFEAGLRLFWASGNQSQPRTQDLLNGVGARRRIPDDLIKHVHGIRGYRNSLVHRAGGDVVSIPIPFARSHLCRFLAFLPLEWPVSA